MSPQPDRLPEAGDVCLMLFCERLETLDGSPWEETFGGEAKFVTWRSHRPYSLINISPRVEMKTPGDLTGVVSLWLRGGVNYAGVALLLTDQDLVPTGEVLPMPNPPDLRDQELHRGDQSIWRMEGAFAIPSPGRYYLVLANMDGADVVEPVIAVTNLDIRTVDSRGSRAPR